VLDNPAITSAVIGIRTLDQLKLAVDSVYSNSLSELEKEKLSETIPVNFYDKYR
jgi:hypothetical protein